MTKYSDAAVRAFPDTNLHAASQREGFDAGIRYALKFLMEQKASYSYYSTIDFDEGYIHALEWSHEMLEMELEPSDD